MRGLEPPHSGSTSSLMAMAPAREGGRVGDKPRRACTWPRGGTDTGVNARRRDRLPGTPGPASRPHYHPPAPPPFPCRGWGRPAAEAPSSDPSPHGRGPGSEPRRRGASSPGRARLPRPGRAFAPGGAGHPPARPPPGSLRPAPLPTRRGPGRRHPLARTARPRPPQAAPRPRQPPKRRGPRQVPGPGRRAEGPDGGGAEGLPPRPAPYLGLPGLAGLTG